MNPFEFSNSISHTKKYLMDDPDVEKEYNSFLVNRGLSYFQDTILFANEMNRLHQIDNKLQYDFLFGIVRKRKRFSKWTKADREKRIGVIQEYYGYSAEKAESISDLIDDSQLAEMQQYLSKGGSKR
jgi:hypothetical protein